MFTWNNIVTLSCCWERQSLAKFSGMARDLSGRIARTSSMTEDAYPIVVHFEMRLKSPHTPAGLGRSRFGCL
jgi:hypothetical protein